MLNSEWEIMLKKMKTLKRISAGNHHQYSWWSAWNTALFLSAHMNVPLQLWERGVLVEESALIWKCSSARTWISLKALGFKVEHRPSCFPAWGHWFKGCKPCKLTSFESHQGSAEGGNTIKTWKPRKYLGYYVSSWKLWSSKWRITAR